MTRSITAASLIGLAALSFLNACATSGHPEAARSETSAAQRPSSSTASPMTTGTPKADATASLLSLDDVNAIVAKSVPGAPVFDSADPIGRSPSTPPSSLPAPCGLALPLYFGNGEPAFTAFATASAVGSGNTFMNQVVATYPNEAAAAARFAQLPQAISQCATASSQAGSTVSLTVGELGAGSATFQSGSGSANSQLPDQHSVNNEYRLAGNAIIGAWSTQSPGAVSAVLDAVRARLGT